MTGKWARCNRDGRPIHPGDQAVLDQFREWLACTDEEKRDPRWHEFLGITPAGDGGAQEVASDQHP